MLSALPGPWANNPLCPGLGLASDETPPRHLRPVASSVSVLDGVTGRQVFRPTTARPGDEPSRKPPSCPALDARKVKVVCKDCLEAARDVLRQVTGCVSEPGKFPQSTATALATILCVQEGATPCVLNMASDKSPGGGYLKGDGAQAKKPLTTKRMWRSSHGTGRRRRCSEGATTTEALGGQGLKKLLVDRSRPLLNVSGRSILVKESVTTSVPLKRLSLSSLASSLLSPRSAFIITSAGDWLQA